MGIYWSAKKSRVSTDQSFSSGLGAPFGGEGGVDETTRIGHSNAMAVPNVSSLSSRKWWHVPPEPPAFPNEVTLSSFLSSFFFASCLSVRALLSSESGVGGSPWDLNVGPMGVLTPGTALGG